MLEMAKIVPQLLWAFEVCSPPSLNSNTAKCTSSSSSRTPRRRGSSIITGSSGKPVLTYTYGSDQGVVGIFSRSVYLAIIFYTYPSILLCTVVKSPEEETMG